MSISYEINTFFMISIATKEQITELNGRNQPTWDDFVHTSPNGLPTHLAGWQTVMQQTYGYDTQYLLAAQAGEVVGVLPLFFVPSRLTGRRAMSMPGGLCAQDESIAEALLDAGLSTAVSHNLNRLILQDTRQSWPGGSQTSSQHVHWQVALEPSEDELWARIDGNIRRQVRKGRKNGLTVEVDRSGKLLDPFYATFSQFTHQAGTPVFGRSFLENIIQTFPDGFNIAVVWYEQQPIAGYFQLIMGDTVYGMWGAALHEYLKLRPAYLAIWEIMADAIAHGHTTLDMGRSPADSNASKFKGQWGGSAQPIYQQIFSEQPAESITSVTNQVGSDGKLALFMRLWPKLPLNITRTVGPRIRWHVPFA